MRLRVELRTTSGIRGDAYFDGEKWREPQPELAHLFEWRTTFTIVGLRSDASIEDGTVRAVNLREEAGSIFVYAEKGAEPYFPDLERAARWAADHSSLREPQLDTALAFAAWSEAREERVRNSAPPVHPGCRSAVWK